MLPGPARMRSSRQFGATIRDGVRSGRPTVVVHANRTSNTPTGQVQVGFVVSKAVGNAVARNRVKRRLRSFALPLMADTPPGVQLVVRALPAAADETRPLADELAGAWRASLRKLQEPR